LPFGKLGDLTGSHHPVQCFDDGFLLTHLCRKIGVKENKFVQFLCIKTGHYLGNTINNRWINNIEIKNYYIPFTQ
jgi:1,4-dihydroxy-2-naphthoyl-CoA synthase